MMLINNGQCVRTIGRRVICLNTANRSFFQITKISCHYEKRTPQGLANSIFVASFYSTPVFHAIGTIRIIAWSPSLSWPGSKYCQSVCKLHHFQLGTRKRRITIQNLVPPAWSQRNESAIGHFQYPIYVFRTAFRHLRFLFCNCLWKRNVRVHYY